MRSEARRIAANVAKLAELRLLSNFFLFPSGKQSGRFALQKLQEPDAILDVIIFSFYADRSRNDDTVKYVISTIKSECDVGKGAFYKFLTANANDFV